MSERESIPLRDVVGRYIGGGWGKDSPTETHPLPAFVIRGTDFTDVSLGGLGSAPLRFHSPSNLKTRRLQAGDLLLEVSGGSRDQPVGRSLLITPEIRARFDGDVICASFCKLVRPNTDRIDPTFFFYFLQAIYADRTITQFQVQSTGISNFQFEAFLDEQRIHLPSLEVQRRSVRVLRNCDALIENNSRRIEILEEMAQAIYREWFVEFRYPGHEDVPLVDTDLGPIPEDWEWLQIREISSECRTSVDPTGLNADVPYFGLEHLPQRSVALSDWGRASEAGSRKYQFEVGDILFGKIRPYFHKVGVPPVAGICSTDAIVVRPNEGFSGICLATVSSDAFVAQAVQTSQGTKMPRANWAVLETYPVAVPSCGLLGTFESYMADTVQMIQTLVMTNRVLRETRDLLLPRLISGEIDPSGLDIELADS
jgi:type I restriction enzyme S subunit